MENQSKLTGIKEVITFLAETFPNCFFTQGEARPLKIGIFQDLVTRMAAHNAISKTQLRSALRFYTASWRYLNCIQPGAVRVDLDGNACGELEAQHIEHAQQKLAEAKARLREKRAKAAREDKIKRESKPVSPDDNAGQEMPEAGLKSEAVKDKAIAKDELKGMIPKAAPGKPDPVKLAEKAPLKVTKALNAPLLKTPAKQVSEKAPAEKASGRQASVKPAPASLVDISQLVVGQQVRVKLGNNEMPSTVREVAKEGVRVQLASGMSMIVRAEHLVL